MFDKVDAFSLASRFKFFGNTGFNDFSDRLSFKFSTFLLIISSLVILMKQYVMKPISCYISTDIGGNNLLEYVENYCWVEGTIPLKFEGIFPQSEKEWNELQDKKILYYQWVPFILCIQAILFYLPQLLWRLFYTKQSGIDLKHLMEKSNYASTLDNEARSKEVIQLARALETLIIQTQEYRTGELSNIRQKIKKFNALCIASKRLGTHLMVFYIFIKVLYLLNAVLQIYFMQVYLHLTNENYTLFGTKIFSDIINGKDWENTLVFSRVAYCVVKLRQLSGANYVAAQCTLPVNMLNEKMYIFFWFWMVLVSSASAISLISWIIRLMVKKKKTAFIRKYLIINDDYKCGEKFNRRIKRFEELFLRNDGLFILQMLASNAGEIITAEIVSQLWKIYKSKHELKMRKDKFKNSKENQIIKLDEEKIEGKCKNLRSVSSEQYFKQISF